METSKYGVTPLGVTIARKQLQGDDLLEKEQIKKTQQRKQQLQQQEVDDNNHDQLQTSSSRKRKRIVTTSWKKKSATAGDGKPQKNASWMALVEGLTVYGLCLFLPSLLGVLMRMDRQQLTHLWQDLLDEICHQSAWSCVHILRRNPLPDPNPPLTLMNFAPDTYFSDVYVIATLTLSIAMARVFLVHWLVPNNLAPQQMEALVRCKSVHLLSADYKQSLTPRADREVLSSWDEIAKQRQRQEGLDGPISMPSFPPLVPLEDDKEQTLMMTPITKGGIQSQSEPYVKTMTTPLRDTSRLQGSGDSTGDMVGLSIDTPTAIRPALSLERQNPQEGGFLQSCSPSNNKNDKDDYNKDDYQYQTLDNDGLSTPVAQREIVNLSGFLPPPVPKDNDPADDEDCDNDTGENDSFGGWKRRGSTASLAAAAAAAVQEEEDDPTDHDDDVVVADESLLTSIDPNATTDRPKSKRLFAAPRYATAVFRLLYTTVSCAMAWYLFRDADFWPSYVGGHGKTERCWDLSGSLSLAGNWDFDFDHRNTVLRRFFLVQASYHLHSGAFHVFSVLLLHVLKSSNEKANKESSSDKNETNNDKKKKQKNWWEILRSFVHPRALLQHSLSLVFLSVAYVFSSLRRLGAIGMFALDMSSLSLHLLQTCLNAPTDSILSRPNVIRGVWAALVVPSFLYFRFVVWPLVGYSAMVESNQWLAQLESALVPGSAKWFRLTFQAWMALWMGFHAIHFKRLVFHPHIQRILMPNTATIILTKDEKSKVI